MKEVPNESYIPSQDLEKIRSRLINHISSMSEADLRIAAKSEADLRAYVMDLFKDVAKLFGYVVGAVIGFGRDLAQSISRGWKEGLDAGLG
ncbi:hypothetical protein PN466_08820 [Roseofilum reptotaenium CS-1145]|uniref:Uncharacterized protein n=1 Tax=Roseofilum reptotaenium AO1-A TaxID=1925591 RepID=A0A1L9QL09_9CYAN|nr:hypothetical protein [Roseofilum reptotaenium]MDB9517050.1 hypothetical protein [Roseofilum reptotaenium CS-1145]OJJ17399.1 hypothetical protein BI308_22840 [Roseofilum reptotaenium AO1-A]